MSEVLLRFIHISDSHLPETRAVKPDRPTDASDLPVPFLDVVEKIVATAQVLPSPVVQARRTIAAINALPYDVDFVMHTGDVSFGASSIETYREMSALFSSCRFPMFVLAGNHDDPSQLHRAFSRKINFKIDFTPAYDYEIPGYGVQIVCLDTSKEFVTDAQLAWLESRVQADDPRPLIVFMHHNVVQFHAFFPDYCALRNASAVRNILQAGHRLRGVFYGHLHVAMDTVYSGVPYFCAPSTSIQFDITPGTNITNGGDLYSLPGFNVVTMTAAAAYVRKYQVTPNEFADQARLE